jgi:hypothetical protein
MNEFSLSLSHFHSEMALSVYLTEHASTVEGVAQWPYKAVAKVSLLLVCNYASV